MSAQPYPSLEAALRALAPHVAFPATPDLAAAVTDRLRSQERVPGSSRRRVPARPRARAAGLRWWPRYLAPAALALIALFAVVMVASPAARAAVVSVFRKVPGIRIVVGEQQRARPPGRPTVAGSASAPRSTWPARIATPSPADTPASTSASAPTPTDTPLGVADFGARTNLAAARAAVRFTVRVPAAFGAPNEVFYDARVGRGMVTMLWPPAPGLPVAGRGVGAVLTQFDPGPAGDFAYFLKELGGSAATFDYVRVNGGEGGWIEGGHRVEFSVPRADGVRQVVGNRLAANTLLWVQGGVTMRLETKLSRAAAMSVAASIR